jgi:hypothetical protein
MERLDRNAFAKLEGKVADRWRIIRQSNHQTIRDMFDGGHSVNSIAKTINLSRAMVNSALDDMGIPRPDVSEGNRRSAAMATEAERKARAVHAHRAIRQIGRHDPTQANHAARKQASGDYIGAGEADLFDKLIAKGLHPVKQAALEGYNIDLLCDHLAVEVHNKSTRPCQASQVLARIIKLLCRGISAAYIRTGPHCPDIADAALNQLVAFYDETSRDPSPVGQYRVIRGDGQIDWTAASDLDDFAAIAATYAALNPR